MSVIQFVVPRCGSFCIVLTGVTTALAEPELTLAFAERLALERLHLGRTRRLSRPPSHPKLVIVSFWSARFCAKSSRMTVIQITSTSIPQYTSRR